MKTMGSDKLKDDSLVHRRTHPFGCLKNPHGSFFTGLRCELIGLRKLERFTRISRGRSKLLPSQSGMAQKDLCVFPCPVFLVSHTKPNL